jgi:hypothetical protein
LDVLLEILAPTQQNSDPAAPILRFDPFFENLRFGFPLTGACVRMDAAIVALPT